METIVKVTSAEYVTHDVRQFRLEKPPGFTFSPGQATELSINKEGGGTKRIHLRLHASRMRLTLSLPLKYITTVKVSPISWVRLKWVMN